MGWLFVGEEDCNGTKCNIGGHSDEGEGGVGAYAVFDLGVVNKGFCPWTKGQGDVKTGIFDIGIDADAFDFVLINIDAFILGIEHGGYGQGEVPSPASVVTTVVNRDGVLLEDGGEGHIFDEGNDITDVIGLALTGPADQRVSVEVERRVLWDGVLRCKGEDPAFGRFAISATCGEGVGHFVGHVVTWRDGIIGGFVARLLQCAVGYAVEVVLYVGVPIGCKGCTIGGVVLVEAHLVLISIRHTIAVGIDDVAIAFSHTKEGEVCIGDAIDNVGVVFGQLDVIGSIDDTFLVGNGSASILRVDASCCFVEEALIDLIVSWQGSTSLVDYLLVSIVGTFIFETAQGIGYFGEGIGGEVGTREVDASAGTTCLCTIVVVSIDLVEFGFAPNGAVLGSPTTVHFELVAAEVPLSVRCGGSAPVATARSVALRGRTWTIVVADEIDAVVTRVVLCPGCYFDSVFVILATILIGSAAPVEDDVVGKLGIYLIVMFAFCLRW